MFGAFFDFLNWLGVRRQRAKGWVDADLRGFTSHRWRATKSMRWNDVRQIDAGRKPSVMTEIFYVVLFGESDFVTVDDIDSGFTDFQAAVLERWPEMESEWTRVYLGSPDVEEYVTLWKSGNEPCAIA